LPEVSAQLSIEHQKRSLDDPQQNAVFSAELIGFPLVASGIRSNTTGLDLFAS
jgi:hypothetical protein